MRRRGNKFSKKKKVDVVANGNTAAEGAEGVPVRREDAGDSLTRVQEAPPPLDPDAVHVRFQHVAWSPAVAGAGENGRANIKSVLQSVSWHLSGSDKVGLIGANGCGKSTQLLMIQGRVEPTGGNIVRYPKNMQIAYMQQEADLDEAKTTLEELRSVFLDRPLLEIDADLERCGARGEASDELGRLLEERAVAEGHRREVDLLIPKLGMADRRETPINELSGGWQMRVALGKIILGKPDLILLDEPTNHIDLETVEFMEHFLKTQDVAMVIVSHDRYFLNRVCTKIVEIYKGKARSYDGDYVNYLKARDASLAQEWRVYQKHQERIKALKKQVKKLTERFVLETAAQKRQVLETLLKKKVPKPEVSELSDFRFPASVAGGLDSLEASPASPAASDDGDDFWGDDEPVGDESCSPDAGEPSGTEPSAKAEEAAQPVLLSIEDMAVAYPDNQVLEGISFSIRQGEKVALVGSNGCGKSTLVRAVVDDLGEGAMVAGSWKYTDAGIAYFPQRLAEFFNYEDASVKDALYRSCGVNDIDAVGGLEVVLKRLRLDGITSDQPVWSLSGGEKARVAFAQFLLQPVALLVLDEPTNHLDIPTRELLEDALKAFQGAALVVSHDRFFLREFATRVVEIADGKIRDYSSWDEYTAAAPPQWLEATQAEESFIRQDANAAVIWGRKKMFRLKKQQGNVGLRRLSARAEEFMPDEEEQRHKGQAELKAEQVVADLISEGLDPALLGPHAPPSAGR